jgi:hypothetical protein
MNAAADAPGKPQAGGGRWAPWAVFAAAVLPYLPGVFAGFTEWDDPYYVFRSKRLAVPGWTGLSDLWRFEYALRDEQVEFFPLRDSVYWVLHQLFGIDPIPYHATNVAFHAVASVLVFVLAQRLGFSRWVALVGGLLFATHPVHTESVVWVSGLKDPLFLSAMLGSLVCYLRYRERQSPALYAASLLLLFAALACKSLALPTVVLMVAAERMIGTATPWSLIAMRVFGPLVLTFGSLAHIVAVGGATHIIVGPHGGSWSSHWVLMAWALVGYVRQAVLPASFRLYYCFAPAQGLADLRLWAAIVALLGLAALGLVLSRRDKRLGFLWLWFFVCLAPVANIVPFPALMADRYLYSPTVGVVLLLAVGLTKVRWGQVLTGAVVSILAAVTALRSEAWSREDELWDEVAEDSVCWEDTSKMAVNVLLQWALTQRDPEKAIAAFRKVTRHPQIKSYLSDYSCDRFIRSAIKERLEDPKLELKAAELMVHFCPSWVTAWERLAVDTWRDRPDIAARAMERAYADSPLAFRRWRLGLARFNAKDPRARADLEAALQWDPRLVCPSFQKWVATVPSERTPELEGLAARCPAN